MNVVRKATQLIRPCVMGCDELDDVRDPSIRVYYNETWYVTTDGEVFSTEHAAIEWQKKLLEEGCLGD